MEKSFTRGVFEKLGVSFNRTKLKKIFNDKLTKKRKTS